MWYPYPTVSRALVRPATWALPRQKMPTRLTRAPLERSVQVGSIRMFGNIRIRWSDHIRRFETGDGFNYWRDGHINPVTVALRSARLE